MLVRPNLTWTTLWSEYVQGTEATKSGIAAVPWGVGDLAKAVVLSLLLMTLALVGLLALGAGLGRVGLSLPVSRVAIVVILIVVQNVSFLVGVWAFGLRKHRVGLDCLGLRPYATARGCGYAVLAFLGALLFNVFYNLVVLGGLDRELRPTPVLPLFGGGLLGFALALALAALLVPFAEEVFFRGFLLPGLARRFGFVSGALICALLFGAAHLNPNTFVPLSFFGLVLAALYGATGSILPGIVIHSVNNSLALLVAYLLEAGLLTAP